MGFELTYRYREQEENGYADEIKTMSRIVGESYEDVPYERLARTIIAQMARRDILIEDVEIYEFARRKVSFRQGKGGLVIGNKKYALDSCGDFQVEEIAEKPVLSEPRPSMTVQLPSSTSVPAVNLLNNRPKRRPLRFEVFRYDPKQVDLSQIRGMSFTVGNRYPIYSEKPAGANVLAGMTYETEDDNGVRRFVNDKFFTPPVVLSGGFEDRENDVDLGFSGTDFPMPKLR